MSRLACAVQYLVEDNRVVYDGSGAVDIRCCLTVVRALAAEIPSIKQYAIMCTFASALDAVSLHLVENSG